MKRFALLLSLAFLAGCFPQQVRPQPPQVELVSFTLVSLDPFTGFADLDVRLRLTNPNGFTLPLLDSTLSAELAGAGFSLTLPALELPSNTPRETQARLRVPIAQGVQALASLVSGRPTRFRLQGELQARLGPVNVPIGPFTLVDRDVTVSFSFIPPALRLVEIRFEGGVFKLVLEVQNPNPIGFNLEGPVRLLIGGRSVAEANAQIASRPGSASRGELSVRLQGFPGLGNVQVQANLVARIPGILERPVVQLLEGAPR
ncbi:MULTISPECIES: LEA type 2 family protein [unclassified Meiothermus]|uniref:NDR1/HIN1-like protein n=1 Tax=unclassified Meiothermus TaxID=370471 RepID=UPI000D7C8563|nr:MULTISPECIES: LEA type 2 family protein [unclassified Meiothermus]PZA07384.1 hypothetical protein DNA98_09325 [Meiothermus sp. Pnk-1]RYM37377.1 hypothetical protein EWH23_06750 [Meiothermus sp. PNK-Is4]